MLAAVFLSRKLTAKRAFLADMVTDANMMNAAVGCMIAGLVLTITLLLVTVQGGSILSALNQLNFFLQLSIILGTIYQIRKSGGRSSLNFPVFISGAAIFAAGVVGFSKQGMFTPMLCWLVAACSQRYKISLYQFIGLLLAATLVAYYLVPYSQYGRNFMTTSFTKNIGVSLSLLSNLGDVRQQYELEGKADREGGAPVYFNSPQGIFDRLEMISVDDALINVTEERGRFGFSPIVIGIEGLVPHFLWPGKPEIGFGNLYAHQIGNMIDEEDLSTGISFSPAGEAFHMDRWVGVFIVAPILWIMLFALFDSLCGDTRKYPWGLLPMVLFAHEAPEGMLGGVIYLLWFGAIGVIVAALAAAYVMPILGSLFAGPERTGLRRIAPIRSIPRRLPAVHRSPDSRQ